MTEGISSHNADSMPVVVPDQFKEKYLRCDYTWDLQIQKKIKCQLMLCDVSNFSKYLHL